MREPCLSRYGEPKKRYPNAQAAIFVANYQRTVYGHEQHAYRCPVCDQYHVSGDDLLPSQQRARKHQAKREVQ